MNRIIKEFYKMMIEKGWTIKDIDESDIFYLINLNKREKIIYANQVPWL